MDAEVVTTSLQSLMPASTNNSWPSVLNHSSSGTDEDDVFQAVSVSQQFFDHHSTDLQYTDFNQSSVAHPQHQMSRTPMHDTRNMSPFGQAFLVPNADSMSPAVVATTSSSAMSVDDHVAASFSQHISSSPVGSDSHAHFTGFGSNVVSTDHNAVFSGSFSVANSGQSVETFLHSDGQSATVLQPLSVAASLGSQPSAQLEQKTEKNLGFPPPPKKPLSPYMRFSKGIWQKVKAENPSSSVCWVGSQIGQIWRELTDVEKQHYIDEFNKDKETYDVEFTSYLKLTGLQASDLVKPRTKKKATKRTAVRAVKQPEGQVSSSGVNQQPTVLVQTTTVPTTGQPNEITIMSVGNGQPDRFVVGRSDGMQIGEMSSLPSISQVWSNSNFVANQELTNQMLIAAGQLAYNQPQLQQLQQQQQEQQRRLAEANAQRISLNGNGQQVVTQYSDTGSAVSHQQHVVFQQPTSYANCTTQAMTSAMVSGQLGTKYWPWHQVSVIPQSSQGVPQSNGTVQYQFPTNGATDWHTLVGHAQNHSSSANQPDRGNQLLLQTDILDSQNLQMISTIQGQYNNVTGAMNDDIYRMNQGASGAREPDQEILKLRAALHEATEQSVHLMKELTVVYAEVHEQKQMNDELREQYRQWEEARLSGSLSSDMDARSGPSGQSV